MPLKWVELNIKVQVAVDGDKTNLQMLNDAISEVVHPDSSIRNENFLLLHYDIRTYPVVLQEDK